MLYEELSMHPSSQIGTTHKQVNSPGSSQSSSGAFFSEESIARAPSRSLKEDARAWVDRAQDGLKQLKQMDRRELQEKAEGILKRYPWQSALVGFTVGALIGRKVLQR